MSCALIDIGCHVQNAAWEWWAGVGLLNKALIIAGIASMIFGVVWSLGGFLKRLGGWPAVIGAFLAITGLVLALLPKKPAARAEPVAPVPAVKPEFQFGVDRVRPRKRPKTILDIFRRGTS